MQGSCNAGWQKGWDVLRGVDSQDGNKDGILGWPNIVKSCGSSDYFNSWRFGGIVDDIFIKTKCQSRKSTAHIANEKSQWPP